MAFATFACNAAGTANPYRGNFTAGKDAIAFSAGVHRLTGLTAGPATGGYVGSGASAPLSSSNCSWNGTTDIKIGQTSGPVYHNGLVVRDFDFRGTNYGFTIYGQNTVFENCIFDMSAWTNNFNTYINVVSTNNAYVSFRNCYLDGSSTPYLVKEFVSGPVKEITNCQFVNIPGDWLFSPSRQDTNDLLGTSVKYTYVKVASTSMDTATRIIAPMTGKSWTNLSDNVTISSGFTIRTTTGSAGTSTNGGTITISAGTYTVQNILDTLNGTPIVVPSGSAQPGLAANVIGGVIYLTAVAWDNNTATSTARSIDISGDATDIARVFGTGMASQRTSASMGNIPVSLAYADGSATPATITYYGAHADGLQVPSTYTTDNPINVYAVIIDLTTDDTTSGSFGQSGNAQQTSPINVTADTGNIAQSVTFDQCTMIISTDSVTHPKEAQYSSNSIAKANLSGGRRFNALFRISNSLLQSGTSEIIRSINSHKTTGTAKAGWANPGTFNATGLAGGTTLTISDGTNTVTVSESGGTINGDALLTAINNQSSDNGVFWLEAYVDGSNRLVITGNRWGATTRVHSNYLVLGGAGDASTAWSTFGHTTGTKTGTSNGNFINPFSFEGNYDYDSPSTPVSIFFDNNGVSATSWNPLPTAPTVSVSSTTGSTATITFAAQSAVVRWQYTLDNGSSWSTLSTDGGTPTVTGTISGLTSGRLYNTCRVRGQNAWGDDGLLKQNGTPSAVFSFTTA